ncbi:MAG TPA: hypothetical protein VML75_19785 [Kofleriaceae bacterium]|nr:hypothetical protein [Kofleriaceae bacterium]
MSRALLLVLGCAAACGGNDPPARVPEPEVPVRAATGAEPLLAVLPAGAALIVELDLARVRANPTAAPMVHALGAAPVMVREEDAMLALGQVLLQRADAVVLASYRVGGDDAATLIAVRPANALEGTTVIGGVGLLGPKAWIERARAASGDSAATVAGDTRLLAVRASAMPAEASGAALRISGVLDFEARVAMASRFELDVVPASISVWGDLADDLAVVALLGGDKLGEGASYARAVKRVLDRMADEPALVWLGLGGVVGGATIESSERIARVVLLMSPKRFTLTSKRLVKQLSARPAPAPAPAPPDAL